jgi:Protein of unknown function (DUF1765)
MLRRLLGVDGDSQQQNQQQSPSNGNVARLGRDSPPPKPPQRYGQWAQKVASSARQIAESGIPPVIRCAAESRLGASVASAGPPSSSSSSAAAASSGSRNSGGSGLGPVPLSASQLSEQRNAMASCVALLKYFADLLETDRYEDVDYCSSYRAPRDQARSRGRTIRGRPGSENDAANGGGPGDAPGASGSGLGRFFWGGRSTATGTLSLETQERPLQLVREAMLNVWRAVLGAIQQRMIESRQADAAQFYRCIVRIVLRREFDPTILRLDVHDRPTCDFGVVAFARRYRALLFLTQMFANKSLTAMSRNEALANVLPHLSAFCARVLAINFFRIPAIGEQVIAAFRMGDAERDAFAELLKSKHECTLPAFRMETAVAKCGAGGDGDNDNDGDGDGDPSVTTAATPVAQQQRRPGTQSAGVMISSYPALFGWKRFHDALVKHGSQPLPDAGAQLPDHLRPPSQRPQLRTFPLVEEERDCGLTGTDGWDPYVEGENKRWQRFVKKRGTLFSVFLRQWVEIVLSALPGGLVAATQSDFSVDWESVPGYNEFMFSFVHDFVAAAPSFERPLLDCTIAMLRTDYALVTVYSSALLRATNVFEFMAVTEMLTVLGNWFDATCLAERDPPGMQLNSAARVHRTLPLCFNTKLFCQALRVIVDTDQHQLVARSLTFLYRWSDVFGTVAQRQEVFLNFLLSDEVFFPLFLHWEPSIRNTFVQLIVYRSLAHGRTELHRRGFIGASELGLVDHAPASSRGSSERFRSSPAIGDAAKAALLPVSELKVDVQICQRLDELQAAVQSQLRQTDRMVPPKYSDRELRMASEGRIKGPSEDAVAAMRKDRKLREAAADPNKRVFPASLEPYAPHALVEFIQYLSRYNEWEQQPDPKVPPPLVPLHVLETHDV